MGSSQVFVLWKLSTHLWWWKHHFKCTFFNSSQYFFIVRLYGMSRSRDGLTSMSLKKRFVVFKNCCAGKICFLKFILGRLVFVVCLNWANPLFYRLTGSDLMIFLLSVRVSPLRHLPLASPRWFTCLALQGLPHPQVVVHLSTCSPERQVRSQSGILVSQILFLPIKCIKTPLPKEKVTLREVMICIKIVSVNDVSLISHHLFLCSQALRADMWMSWTPVELLNQAD